MWVGISVDSFTASDTSSLLRISPIAGGIIAGVLHILLGPDHLCSIVTLSAGQGAEAFWFGVRWAGGHLSGMVVLCAILTASRGSFDLELYEHYMYYFVGSVLLFLGGYFVLYADKYFDAEWAPIQKSCACHGIEEPTAQASRPVAPDRFKHSSYGSSHDGGWMPDGGQRPAKGAYKIPSCYGLRELGSALLGFAQGLACPGGVMGMMFLKDYSPLEMVIFTMIFFAVTILALGLLAMGYGVLTRNYVSSKALARTIYYVSCALSITCGLAWIVLNYSGHLEGLLHHHHDHHGHDHHGALDQSAHDHASHDHHLRHHHHG